MCFLLFVAKLSRNEQRNDYLQWLRNLIGEFTAGVNAEQSCTDLGNQLLSDQLKTRFKCVNDLKEIVRA